MASELRKRDGIEHRLNVLIKLVQAAGFVDIEARMKVERDILIGGISRIAVVGEASAGKSTFINRKVLSEDILPMAGGTAVPVEIHHGPNRRMEIIPYVELSESSVPENTMKSGGMTGLWACEGPPVIITDPTPADIKRHVTRSTLGERARLADTTARVRVFLPSPVLSNLILVDTPGFGFMNRAAVATRYRILPGCDDIFFLSLASTFSSVERAFLDSPMLTDRRIRHLPPGAAWSSQEVGVGSSWSMMVYDGRFTFADRAEPMIRHQAVLARARCAAEMSARRKSATECRRIETEIGILETEIRIRLAKRLYRLSSDLTALKTRMSDTIKRGIMTATAGASRPALTKLESAVAGCAAETKAAIRALAERYGSEGLELLAPWKMLVHRELGDLAVPDDHRKFRTRVLAAIALTRTHPYSILADILPGILNCRPAAIAHRLAVIAADMPRRVEGVFRPIEEILPGEWDDDLNGRMNAVRQGISAAIHRPVDLEREALLREIRTQLDAIAGKAVHHREASEKIPKRSER